jgi:hypothetical protein
MIAAVLTVAFLVIALPFLALTTLYVVGGGSVASQTVLVFAAYAVGVIVVVVFWIRRLSTRRRI